MIIYTDYDFYISDYLGAYEMEEEEFNRLAIRASELLDFFTFERITDVTDRIKAACCALIDAMIEDRETAPDGRTIASENNDGYSVSYASASAEDAEKLRKGRLYDVAYRYLSQTGLMDWSI